MDIVYNYAGYYQELLHKLSKMKIGQYQSMFRKNRNKIYDVFMLTKMLDNGMEWNRKSRGIQHCNKGEGERINENAGSTKNKQKI